MNTGTKVRIKNFEYTTKTGLFVSEAMLQAYDLDETLEILGKGSCKSNVVIKFDNHIMPVNIHDLEEIKSPATKLTSTDLCRKLATDQELLEIEQANDAATHTKYSGASIKWPTCSEDLATERQNIAVGLREQFEREAEAEAIRAANLADLEEEFENIKQHCERTAEALSSDALDSDSVAGSLRYNEGKLRWRNFPMFLMRPLAEVGQYGEAKYDAFNFLKGTEILQYLDCAKRHMDSFEDPNQPDNDPESGVSHLAHSAWNQLVAIYIQNNFPEKDNRWKGNDSE